MEEDDAGVEPEAQHEQHAARAPGHEERHGERRFQHHRRPGEERHADGGGQRSGHKALPHTEQDCEYCNEESPCGQHNRRMVPDPRAPSGWFWRARALGPGYPPDENIAAMLTIVKATPQSANTSAVRLRTPSRERPRRFDLR